MFKQLFNIFFPVIDNFQAILSRIEIQTETPDRLVLRANSRMIALDKASQTLSSPGQVLARFDAIESIDVEHFRSGTKGEWWSISLQLTDRKIEIGKTIDGTQASILAAHISTITGKQVRSLPSWHK